MSLKEILSTLIAFKTITGNKKESFKALNWIKNQLKNFPVYFLQFEKNNFPTLLITTQKTKKPILWLAAHLDVVNGLEKNFKSYIKGNKLYGRGAFDMKFAIACYLKLFQELDSELKKFSVGIMITTDEEVGGWNGTKYILDKGYLSKVCILPDGGENWKIEKGAKGVWHIKIKSFGKSSHGSRPWLGENAIWNLMNFLKDLSQIFAKEPCQDKNHLHSTINIGKIQGGTATNQVPDYVESFVDIRFINKEDLEKIKRKLTELKKKYKKIFMETTAFANNFESDLQEKYHRIFIEIAKKEFKLKITPTYSHGSSDARFFAEKKIPTIVIRPKGGGAHSENEWIDLKDLEKFYIVIKRFVEEIAIENFSRFM
jgi:succinyl-diaminopimelate desuccinylase